MHQQLKDLKIWSISENKNRGKGNGAGLAWDEFVITHTHIFGADTHMTAVKKLQYNFVNYN